MAKVRLARKQQISADGVVLQGTRDFDVDRELDGVDVTPWQASGTAELTLCESATITLQVYHLEDAQRLAAKWNTFPPQPIQLAIDGVGAGQFIVKSMKFDGGFGGILSYTFTFKSWPYD